MGLCLDNINKCEGEMFASSKIKGEQFLMRNYIVSVSNVVRSFYGNRSRVTPTKDVIEFAVELSRELC